MNVSKKILLPFLICTLVSSFGYGLNQKRVSVQNSKMWDTMEMLKDGITNEEEKTLTVFVKDSYWGALAKVANKLKTRFGLLSESEQFAILISFPWKEVSRAIDKEFHLDVGTHIQFQAGIVKLRRAIEDRAIKIKDKNHKLSADGLKFLKMFAKEVCKVLEETGVELAGIKAQDLCITDRQNVRQNSVPYVMSIVGAGFFCYILGMSEAAAFCFALAAFMFANAWGVSSASHESERRLLINQEVARIKKYFRTLDEVVFPCKNSF